MISLAIGSVIGGLYRIEAELGRGGMGVVYRASDESLDRTVALKVLSPEALTGEEPALALKREAKLLAAIRSPHVVNVHAFGTDGALCFFVMEHIAGKTLHAIIAEHRRRGEHVPLHRALAILARAAEGLAAVHAAALIHRDVKPANIMIEADTGRPVVLDLGLAGAARAGEPARGTPAYMAPELIRAGTVTLRTDVYALGCVVHELLTGLPPFFGDPLSTLEKHENAPVPLVSARRPELATFDPVVARALAKTPNDRYESCPAFARALLLAADPSRRPVLEPPPFEARSSGALHVLIVDDDPAFQRFEARAVGLTFVGATVVIDVAGSGAEALAFADARVPDLVLLDYDMPGLDGIDTLSRLRELPGGDRVRVIVMSTPPGLMLSRWRFSILGVKDFIKKPVTLLALTTAIGEIADRAGWREGASK